MEIIDHPPILHFSGIPDHVTYTWIAMLIIIAVSFFATRKLELVPRGAQNFMEMVLDQFHQILDEVIGAGGRRYLPLIGTLGLFILVSNLMGLVPGLVAPTANLNTTAACALIVRKQGALNYLKHFAGPVPGPLKPLMFVIEIISHLARPLSLSLRLFGNMVGGHILIAIFFFMMGFDGLLGWALTGSLGGLLIGAPGALVSAVFVVGFLMPLKILVAFLQAFIFCMLTMIYITGALEEAEHEAQHAPAGHH